MTPSKRGIVLAAVLVTLMTFLIRISTSDPRNSSDHSLRSQLTRHFPYDPTSQLPKQIWQTWKLTPADDDFDELFRYFESTWTELNPDFHHEVLSDEAAASLVAELFAELDSVREAYEALPEPILKADFFRYLILLARGGVYTDIDTSAIQRIKDWLPNDIGSYGLVVGIEADPDRPDWADWYARRIQFCQWTIMGKRGHPVLVEIVASITEKTLALKQYDQLKSNPVDKIMDLTGPGIWTDTLFKHFNQPLASDTEKNITWKQFANLTRPMKEGDVVVLPITSFSPGIGHMGSGDFDDPMAFVRHEFSGTWKHDEQ